MDESIDNNEDSTEDTELDNGEEDSTDSDDAAPKPKSSGASKAGADGTFVRELELPSLASKEAERRALQEAMERFLQQGGKIQQLPPSAEK